MINNILYIAAGGAFGSVIRYIITYFFKIFYPNFPIGTLLINVLGSFLIGLLVSYMQNSNISENIFKYFLIIGLLGSFTTFSAFSIETLELFRQEKIILSFIYVISSITLTLCAAYVGFIILR